MRCQKKTFSMSECMRFMDFGHSGLKMLLREDDSFFASCFPAVKHITLRPQISAESLQHCMLFKQEGAREHPEG